MQEQVRDYYGRVLESSGDLQTNACCAEDSVPEFVRGALARVHEEVLAKYYGCGLVIPVDLEGLRVLDLGCGSGRDCYVLSQLVGEKGKVIGIDMTDEQLAVAMRHLEYHRCKFGYSGSNVSFIKGYIEELDQLDLAPGSFDLIVSNCVINLSPDKEAVLRHAWNLLKPGGEMYFSDVYSDRRVPAELVSDPVLYGECLGGALYRNDFLSIARYAGFTDPRLVEDRVLTVDNPEISDRVRPINFSSATYRLFKIDSLEPTQEDYGQKVNYKGSLKDSPDAFSLDNHHVFDTGIEAAVSGNTWKILKNSRFNRHFDFHGEGTVHLGEFGSAQSGQPSRKSETHELSINASPSGCC